MSAPPRPRRSAAAGPHVPPDYEAKHIASFQALQHGEATPHQQQLALEWLMLCAGTYDLSYRPGDPTATAFAEGKRFVGLQVRKMLVLNAKAFTKEG
jgi:hypothetical protein